ncbi:M28 family peptidase, partial [bacterium]|nr:M28 family peptidase [bacterium]
MWKKATLSFIFLLLILCLISFNTNSIGMAEFKIKSHTKKNIESHVKTLSENFGERNLRKPLALQQSSLFIQQHLKQSQTTVQIQKYWITLNKDYLPVAMRNKAFSVENIYVTLQSDSTEDALVVGAHYDTFIGTSGADDNASSVSILLEIIRDLSLSKIKLKRPIIFVFFTLEEPPFFKSPEMGSYQFAKMLKEQKTKLLGMISLDCIGYFSEKQSYPFPLNLFYKSKGDFLTK